MLEDTNIKNVIDAAMQNDDYLIIKLLLKSNKINMNTLQDLLEKAKGFGSKKIGRLLLNVLRVIEGCVGSGNISTTGIQTWCPTDNGQTLPYELIEHIGTLSA